jgi:hypothetical protein
MAWAFAGLNIKTPPVLLLLLMMMMLTQLLQVVVVKLTLEPIGMRLRQ